VKKQLLVIALCATAFIGGCKNSSGQENSEDYRTAMQKQYSSESACRQEFPTAGDCVRQTNSTGGSFFMSPLFYPWGAIYHNNGRMEYNRAVPSSGYSSAPRNLQAIASSKTNFSRAPSVSGGTTRGGFGSTGARSVSSSRSSGG
jgi:hypothetical protein